MIPQARTRGISFVDDLVLAIEDGDKVETRRAVTKDTDLKRCPYGKVGERLYVRQTYRVTHLHGPYPNEPRKSSVHMRYRARGEGKVVLYAQKSIDQARRALDHGGWRPPMFMTRWAARTFLELEDVRLERVREITPDGVRREGLARGLLEASDGELVDNFAMLWDKINGDRGYDWSANPLCWVLRFRAIPRPDPNP